MPKHSRKRQRTGRSGLPLGSRVALTDDASKDDEERRLESMLFGTPFVPSGKGKGPKGLLAVDDQEKYQVGDAGKELEGLLDTDVSSRKFGLACLLNRVWRLC